MDESEVLALALSEFLMHSGRRLMKPMEARYIVSLDFGNASANPAAPGK